MLACVGHHVVKHGIVAGVFLHDLPHGGGFMGIEDCAVPVGRMQHGRQGCGHTHVLMGHHNAVVVGSHGSQGLDRRQGRLGQPHVLLVIPAVLVAVGVNGELVVQFTFEQIDQVLIHIADVDQQHLRRDAQLGPGAPQCPPSIDDADVILTFDLGQGRGILILDLAVQRRKQHVPIRPQPVLSRAFGAE